jgi:CHAT domain-containing protein
LLQQVQLRKRSDFHSLFAIQNPTEDLYRQYEHDLGAVGAIKKQFTDTYILKESNAAKSAILPLKEALQTVTPNEKILGANCLFFFCHGYFDRESPVDSGLQLADENLTLADIITHFDLKNCRLVTLSACETGLTDFRNFSDEYISLPYGFLLAGTTNVVSSLWTVSATATALLMIKFYEELQQQNQIAVALNTAQSWLRNTTVQGFQDWLVQSQLSRVWQRQLLNDFNQIKAKQGATAKPFEQPYYWAAFCAIGKGE